MLAMQKVKVRLDAMVQSTATVIPAEVELDGQWDQSCIRHVSRIIIHDGGSIPEDQQEAVIGAYDLIEQTGPFQYACWSIERGEVILLDFPPNPYEAQDA